MSAFTTAQTEQLLKPISGQRVLRDGKGHSHVSQQDVTAHLIRVFGFGGFDTEIISVECVFEDAHVDKKGEVTPGRFDVCYRASLRLTVKDEAGRVVAQYEDGSTATAQNQTRGDAHDLAYKSAISLAKKRAAINLGDQFGLSLYNKGQTDALVRGTLVKPEPDAEPAGDMQDGVPAQVVLGNDETDYEPGDDTPPQAPPAPDVDVDSYRALIDAAGTVAELGEVGSTIATLEMSRQSRTDLRAYFTGRMQELKGAA